MTGSMKNKLGALSLAAAGLMITSCGAGAAFLNPAFVNQTSGGIVPLTPGPLAAFVMVRCVNETGQLVEFIVTIEREVLVRDDDGNFQVDENNEFVTRPERQTVNLVTQPTGTASELSVLFSCNNSPVNVVGLGEDLSPDDVAVFVGGAGAGGAAGFGVGANRVNPLSREAGNFDCGDTIIFQAFQNTAVAGGVDLRSFLLAGSEQPSEFAGPSTFENFERILEDQLSDDDP